MQNGVPFGERYPESALLDQCCLKSTVRSIITSECYFRKVKDFFPELDEIVMDWWFRFTRHKFPCFSCVNTSTNILASSNFFMEIL